MKKLLKKTMIPTTAMITLLLTGCSSNTTTTETKTIAYNEATTPHYDVVRRDDKITLDGEINEKVWEDVPVIAGGFHYPWEDKEAPLTEFKGYNDGVDFYFAFKVIDKDVIVEEEWAEDESTVDKEDRVELFFAGGSVDKPTKDGMPLYYGIEVDPNGRVHDYSIKYYRDFDSTWKLDGLETKGVRDNTGYTVEGKISLKSLKDLKLMNNEVMRVGVYRAEFSTPEKGEEPVMQWISWVDPKTEEPDFHVDSSFGEFRFLK